MTDFNQNVLETFIKSFSCSDQDVEDFEQRVFSFIEGQKWVSRPLILSPLICARYGWKCVNPNLLECVACSAKLCTHEPRIEVYDTYKSCLDKIVADLKDGHKTHCPWPLAPSPESFVKMVPLPKEEALSQFLNRLKPCLTFECSIPQVKDSIPSQLGLKQEDVCSIFKHANITPKYKNEIGMSIVCLAATGWTLLSKKNGEMMTYIKCDCCQRLIWAKSYNFINALSTDDVSNTKNGTHSGKESSSNIENGTNSEKESSSNIENGANSEKESSSNIENRTDSEKESSKIENETNSEEESSSNIENGANSAKESSSNIENGANSEKESSSNIENGTNSGKESSRKRNLDNDTLGERSHKRLKLDKRDFDPLEEHRPWCRWVSNADTRRSLNDKKEVPLPGWKLYMKSLLRNILSSQSDNSECTPSKEHVRSVRDLLESWTSPTSL